MTATTLPKFNPSGSSDVDIIKSTCEELLAIVKQIDGDPRCKSIALTKIEEASMWAVKSLFVGEDK
jgi:hypothetical protein